MRKDLTGKKFGRFIVLGLDEERSSRRTYWNCQCDCGNVKSVRSDSLQSGRISSCGCRKKETDVANLSKNHSHKGSNSRLYFIWQGMKARCYNPNNSRFPRYGGRGIKVWEEWKEDFSSFQNWALSNGYADTLTIDRINNDGNYQPDNCRWADRKNQSNNRSTNIVVDYKGFEGTITEVCEKFTFDPKMIFERYKRGDRGERLFRETNADRVLNLGEKCHKAKINQDIALQIKKKLADKRPATQIAKELNVSKHIVYDIKRGKTWSWL